MLQAQPGDVTRLLRDWGNGSQEALNQLVPLVYGELCSLAAAYHATTRYSPPSSYTKRTCDWLTKPRSTAVTAHIFFASPPT